MKETPTRNKSWSKNILNRVSDLQDVNDLPYEPVEEREGKIPPNNHNYTPAKPLEKTKIIKQKKRDFLRK